MTSVIPTTGSKIFGFTVFPPPSIFGLAFTSPASTGCESSRNTANRPASTINFFETQIFVNQDHSTI